MSDSLKEYISNVKSFKTFIDTVVEEIDSGEYNVDIIKKLSECAEEFFSNIDEKPKLTPKTFMYDISDEEDDDEMEDIGLPNFIDDPKPKPKDKMIEEFLNNDINSYKYHYLTKTQRNINVFCESCYTY
jgi:hypothetical protein